MNNFPFPNFSLTLLNLFLCRIYHGFLKFKIYEYTASLNWFFEVTSFVKHSNIIYTLTPFNPPNPFSTKLKKSNLKNLVSSFHTQKRDAFLNQRQLFNEIYKLLSNFSLPPFGIHCQNLFLKQCEMWWNLNEV